MFMAVLLTLSRKNGNNPNVIRERMAKQIVVFKCNKISLSKKGNKVLTHTIMQINLKNMLSERRQTKKLHFILWQPFPAWPFPA